MQWESISNTGTRRSSQLTLLLLIIALCPLHGAAREEIHSSRARSRIPMARPALSRRTKMLTEKIKQIADRMLDKHATVQSTAELIGRRTNDGGLQCELTPRDPNFRTGYIRSDEGRSNTHLPVGQRRPDYLSLTLTKDALLTPDELERMFGKWHTVPSLLGSNPNRIVFDYPSNKALFSIAVFAELDGFPEEQATRVTSITLHRNDFEELMHH